MVKSVYPNGFSNGVTIRGANVVNNYAGTVYWVDSNAGSDQNKGTERRPFATIDKAIGTCSANNGDIIMLKPGHAEDISDATTFQVDTAGTSIIGIGNGAARPTFTFTGTGGRVEVDSASTSIENVRFLASVSAVVVGMNVDADNCRFIECEWDYDATGDDFLIFVDVQDVAGTEFYGCTFKAEEGTAGSNEAIRMDNADETKIVGCDFFGDFANAAIWSDTSGDTGDGSTISNQILISRNTIHQDDTANGTCIDLNNADTGVIEYNSLTTTGSTGVAAALDPGSCACVENYATSQVDKSASLVPATTDTIS